MSRNAASRELRRRGTLAAATDQVVEGNGCSQRDAVACAEQGGSAAVPAQRRVVGSLLELGAGCSSKCLIEFGNRRFGRSSRLTKELFEARQFFEGVVGAVWVKCTYNGTNRV